MLLLMSVLILMQTSYCTRCSNVGSVIFHNYRIDRKCWSQQELAKLKARQVFENVCLPTVTPLDKIDSKYVKHAVTYFRKALSLVNSTGGGASNLLCEALADVIGGHLQSEILPSVRMAYYAGYIPFGSAQHIHEFYDEIKEMLNTQGLGWRNPSRIPEEANLTVNKIVIGTGKLFDPCASLITQHDPNGCIHLPSPKLDDVLQPSAIAIPFKSGGLVALSSPKSENIVLKFYTTAARCILSNSPEKCRHKDFANFNKELWHWMKREVAAHLVDDKLYPAYGGVLRVAAAVQSYGRSPSRRNLYELDCTDNNEKGYSTYNNAWRSLTEPRVYVCSNWTPGMYLGFIFTAVLLVMCLQMSYNFLFGNKCCCQEPQKSKRRDEPSRKPQRFSRVQTNCVATSLEDCRRAPIKAAASQGQMRTTQVYDLNENKEKFMSVIMSEYASSIISDPSTSATETSESEDERAKHCGAGRSRPSSPPKIQAPISELKIERCSRKQMYSTSLVSQSEITTYRSEQPRLSTRYSATTTSGSTSSSTSNSRTLSNQYTCRRPKKSRDSSWSKSLTKSKKHTGVGTTKPPQSTTGTEVDFKSHTAAPVRR